MCYQCGSGRQFPVHDGSGRVQKRVTRGQLWSSLHLPFPASPLLSFIVFPLPFLFLTSFPFLLFRPLADFLSCKKWGDYGMLSCSSVIYSVGVLVVVLVCVARDVCSATEHP